MTEQNQPRKFRQKKIKMKRIDFLKTVLCFCIATFLAYLLKRNGDTTDAMAVIFMLTVVIVSRITDGYIWGILASLAGILATNYIFTYPYMDFNFSLTGYSVTFSAMLVISIMISALTTQNKKQTEAAIEMAEKLQETYEEQRAIEIVAQKERLKSNLLRAISHDLRTPLTTIIGASATVLENRDTMDRKTADYLIKDINEEAQWLLRMVENLLAVTHISEDTMKVIKSPQVGEEIIAEAIDHLKIKLNGHPLTVKVPDEILIIPMDGTLIEQVIINLLDNALKHAGPGCSIFIGLSQENDNALFEVSDNGKGLSQQAAAHLFEYGEKSANDPSSDATRGFGIGLPTCKTIIQAHSGRIWVESAPDQGCRFFFTLPLEDPEESDPQNAPPETSVTNNAPFENSSVKEALQNSLHRHLLREGGGAARIEELLRFGLKNRAGSHENQHKSLPEEHQKKENPS